LTTYVLRNEEIKARAIDEIQSLYKPMELVLRPVKRSSSQNAYWHKLMDIIADYTGDDPENIKIRIKYSVLPLREVRVGDKIHMHPISSAELSKEDFSRLIEATLQMGMMLGLHMPSADHYGLEVA
jgi:hypothetical protein